MTSEFDLIELFLSAFPRAKVPVGPGDDCAVLAPARGQLCVTTDAVVEGVHFSRPAFSPEDVGHKALAVNLSDLAAMGARPTWFVCALGLSAGDGPTEVQRLAKGMAALARTHRIALVGGNFTRSPVLSVTLTAAGEVKRGRALLRKGAKSGDLLYVSGTLGEARLGVALLGRASRRRGLRINYRQGLQRHSPSEDDLSSMVDRQRRPTPRVALGLLAARFAHAAIDLSDGLAQDLGHLCQASRAAAQVELARLPLSPALVRCAGGQPRALAHALAGGEDYELCLAVPRQRARAFERACERAGERVTLIGHFAPGTRPVFRDEGGREVTAPSGFDHFG
ncbi:MAG: thiamine-phosphate kinase [Myxococcaceae bacterium]